MMITDLDVAAQSQTAQEYGLQYPELHYLTGLLLGDIRLEQQALVLNLGYCHIRVRSNAVAVLQRLQDYFKHIVVADTARQIDIEVIAIEQEAVSLPVEFQDWKREPGKSGRKESVYDVAGGRFIYKVRTGMLFLQSMEKRIAIGPCLQNDNQVINFINNQYMTWLQQGGWQNCHAAALVKEGYAYAVAGFSGGGKSTLMLQMMEEDGTQFLSNDRLFIQPAVAQLQAVGVPKMPRINPGTIIHNPRLQHLIPKAEREELLALSPQALWNLEQKYDVDIEAVYGQGRITHEAPLKSFLVLNWQRETDAPLQLKKVDLRMRPDLLTAIMKAPGPFYQQPNGEFAMDKYDFNPEAYLQALALIDVYEATGQVDFARLATHYFMQEEI